jgi:transposase
VRPYVKRNKTDRTDAKGILEASRNEDIRPVPIKTVPQQVLTSLHRLRQGWMTERTARLNALRGLLRELGVFIPVGADNVVPAVWALIEDADSELPEALRPLFAAACQEIREIEARIKQVERQLDALAEQLPAVVYLLSIPGIGLLAATALVAFIGDVRLWPPRPFSSIGCPRADSVMARSPKAPPKRPEIRLRSAPFTPPRPPQLVGDDGSGGRA